MVVRRGSWPLGTCSEHLLLRYSSQMIDLEHKLKPFIPDFIPAVGDIDAFLKVRCLHGHPLAVLTGQGSPALRRSGLQLAEGFRPTAAVSRVLLELLSLPRLVHSHDFCLLAVLERASLRGGDLEPSPRKDTCGCFVQVPRPDGKPDNLGLLVLDEPSTKQSDPTVLSLWLTENSKQHNVAVREGAGAGAGHCCVGQLGGAAVSAPGLSLQQQIKVKSLENAEKNPKAIDSWIESISELHRCKPPATVHYAR